MTEEMFLQTKLLALSQKLQRTKEAVERISNLIENHPGNWAAAFHTSVTQELTEAEAIAYIVEFKISSAATSKEKINVPA